MTTYREARIAVYNTLKTRVEARVAALDELDDIPNYLFDDLGDDDFPNISKNTLVVYVRHYASNQKTIGGETRNLFERKAFALVKVWVPKNNGLKVGDALAYIVKSAFEGKRALSPFNDIIFRSVRVSEQGIIKDRLQITVTADFEYTEAVERTETW